MLESSWLMRRLASVVGIKGVESVATAAVYELRMQVRLEAVLSAVSRDLISDNCVVVVEANWSRATSLFLVAIARL